MAEKTIKRRCVLSVGGYEPASPERQYERFVRELARFETAWSARAVASGPALSPDGSHCTWKITTSGPNWQVETDYVLLRWDDFVAADFALKDDKRLARGIFAFADFIRSGTLVRYFRTNWRYALFFLYPILLLLLASGAAVAAGIGIIVWSPPAAGLLAALASCAVFAGLWFAARSRLMLAYIVDDWIFARDYVHRRRPEVDARVDDFARELADRMRDPRYDEVVVAGHSLGAPYSVDTVDRALRLEPGGREIGLLSTGSSLLKVALHPKAGWLREAVARVSAARSVVWAEYQAMVDVINFYKTDPIKALGLPPTGRPSVQIVHMRDMLSDASYRRFRGDFFRIHRQFVMGNEKRYFYDYFSVCCGPLPFRMRVEEPGRIAGAFRPDGGLVEEGAS